MKEPNKLPDDPQLSGLLRQARVSPGLPPRFQQNVWRRLGDAEAAAPAGSWLDSLAGLFLRPRVALAAAAVILLAGGLAGTMQGRQLARQDAQMNYLAAVAPQTVR
jgi:hypothetical protein